MIILTKCFWKSPIMFFDIFIVIQFPWALFSAADLRLIWWRNVIKQKHLLIFVNELYMIDKLKCDISWDFFTMITNPDSETISARLYPHFKTEEFWVFQKIQRIGKVELSSCSKLFRYGEAEPSLKRRRIGSLLFLLHEF